MKPPEMRPPRELPIDRAADGPAAGQARGGVDGRPAADLDDGLPQATGFGEPAPRRGGHAGARARVAARRALHPLHRGGGGGAPRPVPRPGPPPRPRDRPWPIWSAARSSTRCSFEVSPAVLIPRPESEFVVVEFLALTKALESVRAVDVGHGLGLPGDRLGPTSTRGPDWWRSTSARRPWRSPARTRPRTASLTASTSGSATGWLPSPARAPSTSIVSNPPYIPTADCPSSRPASATTSRTSPSTAVPTASTVVRGLVEQSVPLLKPGGHIILEIGTAQEEPRPRADRRLSGPSPRPDYPRPRWPPEGDPGDARIDSARWRTTAADHGRWQSSIQTR